MKAIESGNDGCVVIGGAIQRRQQVIVQEDIVVNGAGMVEQLGRALQDSQDRNDERLMELAQYAHDHAITTAADTEQRLNSHIHEYLENIHVWFEDAAKEQVARQTEVMQQYFGRMIAESHNHIEESTKTAYDTLAAQLEAKVNAAILTMETNISSRYNEYTKDFDRQLHIALQQSQEGFESAADVHAAWIERRLNAKLSAAKEAADLERERDRKANVTQLKEHAENLKKFSHKEAQDHANMIEERLQKKLDSQVQTMLKGTQDLVTAKCDEIQHQLYDKINVQINTQSTEIDKNLHELLRSHYGTSETKFAWIEQELSDLKSIISRNLPSIAETACSGPHTEESPEAPNRLNVIVNDAIHSDKRAIKTEEMSINDSSLISQTCEIDNMVQIPVQEIDECAAISSSYTVTNQSQTQQNYDRKLLEALAEISVSIHGLLANVKPDYTVNLPRAPSMPSRSAMTKFTAPSILLPPSNAEISSKRFVTTTTKAKRSRRLPTTELANARLAATKIVQERVLLRERELRRR